MCMFMKKKTDTAAATKIQHLKTTTATTTTATASAETCEKRDKAVPNQGGGKGWVECTCDAHPGHYCSDHSPSNECFIDPGYPDCACCNPSEDLDEDDHGRLTQTDGINHQDAEEDVQCYCFKCETEWTCQVEGGDWGANEDWVCEKCLPTCKGCEKKLFERDDECCGSGRTDDDEDDTSTEEEMMETEHDMRSRRNCLDLNPVREDFKKLCQQEQSDHEVVAFTHNKIQKRCYALELQMLRDDFKRFRKNKMISFPKTAKEFTLQGETWFYICVSHQTECENSPEVLGYGHARRRPSVDDTRLWLHFSKQDKRPETRCLLEQRQSTSYPCCSGCCHCYHCCHCCHCCHCHRGR